MGGFFKQKVLLVLGCGELLVGFDEVARAARVFHPDRAGGRNEKPFSKERTQQDREGPAAAIEEGRGDENGEKEKQKWEAVEILVEREAEGEHGRNDKQGREITHSGQPAAGEKGVVKKNRRSRTALRGDLV